MGIARTERRELVELFTALGPDAPTLCGDWRTRDLAAHLVLRERRPDAAPGIALSVFAGHTQRVQEEFAAKPWAELLELIRAGPPWYSPFGLPGLEDLVNGAEYFIHHEDVRRAQPGWEPRELDQEPLWRTVRMSARLTYRKSPVGLVLQRPDGQRAVVKKGPSPVTIVGEPAELLMHSFGRDQARVELQGEARAVAVVENLDRSM
ncbi:TIGR03085 family metal-binding protein [Crossiella sp. SN42]|uniref:TIGR03085 family metal-binding protein n=1 Tax=Crossiella sp. SN42 TaxID=2944808 RepID=UPI00207CF1E5|nr:TIGR03085 family metal-binding protein [Crossiella sp. SN42]MCO1576646.1 TIGR03085 family metal-binding protein [Crossiella sp. SN42]